MAAVPADIPDTDPEEVTLAIEGALLLHVPAGVAFARDIVDAGQTVDGPVVGVTPTETTVLTEHEGVM